MEIGDQISEKSGSGDPVIIAISLVLAIVVLGFCVAWVQQKRERRE